MKVLVEIEKWEEEVLRKIKTRELKKKQEQEDNKFRQQQEVEAVEVECWKIEWMKKLVRNYNIRTINWNTNKDNNNNNDKKQAYDTVDRERLLEILEGYDVGPNMLGLLKFYWENQRCVAKAGKY